MCCLEKNETTQVLQRMRKQSQPSPSLTVYRVLGENDKFVD